MLRLFKIEKHGELVYFDNKRLAQRERQALLAEGKHTVIMRGPDHWKGESFNVSKRTPKRKKSRN